MNAKQRAARAAMEERHRHDSLNVRESKMKKAGEQHALNPSEAREHAEILRYKQISLGHESLLIRYYKDTWLSTYRARLTEEHSPTLVALLAFLEGLALPIDLQEEILMDLLANGEVSTSARHLRPAMLRCYQIALEKAIRDINTPPTMVSPSPIILSESQMEREVKEAVQALAVALEATSSERQLGGWNFRARVNMSKDTLFSLLSGRAPDEFTLTWNMVAEHVSRHFHVQGYRDTRATVNLLRTVNRDSKNFALHGHAMNNRTWLEQLMEFSEGEREDLGDLLIELSTIYQGEQNPDLMEAFLSGIYEAQEFVTPRRLLEFSTALREYNMEWAVASFQWLRDGEESQVLATLDGVLNESPWSDHRHGGGV